MECSTPCVLFMCQERTETWDEDLKKLREVMEKARSPCGMLVTKMKEIEDGTFVAINRDKRMKYLVEKFKLDKTAETSISDILARCSKEKQEEQLGKLEKTWFVEVSTGEGLWANVKTCHVLLL